MVDFVSVFRLTKFALRGSVSLLHAACSISTNLHKSLLLSNHCICTFDFFYICELSFNRDLAHC